MKKIITILITALICIGFTTNSSAHNLSQIDQDHLSVAMLLKEKNYSKALNILKSIPDSKKTFLDFITIAYLYEKGIGTDVNYQESIKYYLFAEYITNNKKEKSEVLNEIGHIYYIKHDYIQSFKYDLESAKLGNPTAQYNVSLDYYYGHGTLVNYIQSYAWISVAIANGLPTKQIENIAQYIKQESYSTFTYTDCYQADNISKQYYKLYSRNNF